MHVKWDFAHIIAFIILFIKLILLVLCKHFICYQDMFPLFFIYLIPWTCMSYFYIFLFLITSYYVFITSLIFYFSGIHVMCIIRHLLCYTCWTNPIVLWKCFGLRLRYIPFIFLYTWFHLICISCVSSILLDFCYYHLCIIFVLGLHGLQINCHDYVNLINWDIYLGFRRIQSYNTFQIGNLIPEFIDLVFKDIFPNKE